MFSFVLIAARRSASNGGELLLLLAFVGIIVVFWLYHAIPEWIYNHNEKIERIRWMEIEKIIPPLPKINIDFDFDKTQYRIRGMCYSEWFNEFSDWAGQYGYSSSRISPGKDWAKEDREWHCYFYEWEKTIVEPALKKMNDKRKIESEKRLSALTTEYERRYGKSPNPNNVPERFFPETLKCFIHDCYTNGRRNYGKPRRGYF